MDKEFVGKVALITGGTSGIGEATALAFANLGANVVITGRRKDLGDKVWPDYAPRMWTVGSYVAR